ncbi:Multidrug resistance-associated protein 1, partial [Stegodyphus mimosarum]
GSSLPSRLTFSWLLRVLTKSVKSSLHQDYLVPLCYELKTVNVARDFYHECATGSRQNVTSQAQEEASLIENGEEDLESQDDVVLNTQSFPEKKSLFPILIKVALKFLLIASFLELVLTLLYFLPSYILNLILSKGKEDQEWHNYVYATALFVVLLFSSLADSQRKYYGLMAALRIKTAVMNAVFEKVCRKLF